MNGQLNIPTEEENLKAEEEFFRTMEANRKEQKAVAEEALKALDRLAIVMQDRSGQPYKVRSILFSLWNGKPTSLVETVNLDWAIRKDVCSVIAAFGYEDRETKCFYEAIEQALKKARVWNWFVDEQKELTFLRDYLKAAEREGL